MVESRSVIPAVLNIANRREGLCCETLDSIAGMRRVPRLYRSPRRRHQVPEAGGIVIVSFPKPRNGSGFPARVIAIVP